MTEVPLSCTCGALKGVLHDVSRSTGTRVVCYCKDCQAFARHLGAHGVLDEQGGTDIYQTLPQHFEITSGAENLGCLRLSPKGLLRWYATCCNTPLCNTLANEKFYMVGVLSNTVLSEKAALGPIKAQVNVAGAIGGGVKSKGQLNAVVGILTRQLGAMIWKRTQNPFFTDVGNPVVVPLVLSLEERQRASEAPKQPPDLL